MSVTRASSCAWVCAFGLATAGAQAQSVAAPAANVIPAPASVVARPGSFTLRGGTQIFIAPGQKAARVGAYFAQLLRASHGLALRVKQNAGATPGEHGVVFRLDPAAPGTQAGSYQLEVSAAGAVVSARDPQGLFYGAVTLWQLCSAQALSHGRL